VIATVPFAEFVFATIAFGPPSGSVSFASTSIAVAPESSETVAASSTAVGGVSVGAGVVVELVVVVGLVVVAVVVVDVVELVVVVVVVVVDVVVVLVGGGGVGTRTLARKFLLIVSGGSTRSTSWIRFARTRIEHTVPGARCRLGVSLNLDAGEELSENLFPCLLGHSSPNERFVARTRSLKRTDNTPAADIDTDTTRGAASAEDDSGTSPVSHEPPPAADTAAVRPSGAASATATTFHHQTRKRALLDGDGLL
jgi:hypothetical protein